MSLANPVVPRLELDRPSLADRIRAFKSSLSDSSSSSRLVSDPGTFRRTNDHYNSIDDIVSLLRTRAVESVPAGEPSEDLSSIIEELRSKNNDISVSSPPREIPTAVRVVEKPPQVNIEDLVRRLTTEDEDEDDSPEKILARIKSRLDTTPRDSSRSNPIVSVVPGNRIIIDSEQYTQCGVGTEPEIVLRRHEMVKLDPVFVAGNLETLERRPPSPRNGTVPWMIPDLVLLPHQLPYIAAESTRIRGEIFRKIKS